MVGKEREFLNWFFEGPNVSVRGAIAPESIDEYLRTFAGVEGVLGSLDVYRAAFETIAQTAPLTHNKLKIPVVALGGEKGLGRATTTYRCFGSISFPCAAAASSTGSRHPL